MTNRTVTIDLILDPARYMAGSRSAEQATVRLAAQAQSSVQRSAQASVSAADAAARSARTAADQASQSSQRSSDQSRRSSQQSVDAITRADRTLAQGIRQREAQLAQAAATRRHNMDELARGGAIVGAALAGGFLISVAAAAKFEKALSGVRAVSDASTRDMAALRKAALDAGAATVFSATEAANAEAELAKAGVSTADILGGALTGALSLAAAGQLDLAEASTIAAQAMNIFQLKGKDVGHVADVLAAGANKSATDVHDLGMALKMGGLLAAQTNLSLEQTVGTLAAFADRALIGSDAGTSLKTMLMRLNPSSKEAATLMDELGITAYDAQGEFIGLEAWAGRLQKGMSGLTTEQRNAAMSTIFGADATRAATIVYQLGAEGIAKYTRMVNDQGAASRMAAIQLDNLAGDLEALKGSLETALINGGTAANDVLREMVQMITKVVNAYNALPAPLQAGATALAGLSGAILLVGSATVLLLPRLVATRDALVALGVTANGTRTALAALGKATVVLAALGAAMAAVNALTSALGPAPASVDKLTASMINLAVDGKASGEAIRVFGKDLEQFGEKVARVAHPSVMGRLEDSFHSLFSLGFVDGSPKLQEATKDLDALDKSLANLVQQGHADLAAQSFSKLAIEAQKNGTSVDKLRTLLPAYGDALVAADAAQKANAASAAKASGATDDLGKQVDQTEESLKAAKDAAKALANQLDYLSGRAIAADQAAITFESNIDALTAAVQANGRSLDITSDSGRKVKSAILEAADAAARHAQQVANETGSVEAANKVYADHVAQLRRVLTQAGFTRAQVDDLINRYAQIPKSVTTNVKVTAPSSINIPIYFRPTSSIALGQGYNLGPGIAANSNYTYGGRIDRKDGGIVEFFGSGGIREDHRAQVARGTMRVWAEPETGGEAYIPLSAAKRGQSLAVLADVAERFGYALQSVQGSYVAPRVLTPTGSSGAASTGKTGTSGPALHIDSYYAGANADAHQVAEDLWWKSKGRG